MALAQQVLKVPGIGFQQLGSRGNLNSLRHLTFLLFPYCITLPPLPTNYRYHEFLSDRALCAKTLRLRRARIGNEHHGGLSTSGDLTHEAIVRLSLTEHPPTPVEVHDRWEGTTGSLRSNDPQRDLTGRAATKRAVR